jgi:hypothetical protein
MLPVNVSNTAMHMDDQVHKQSSTSNAFMLCWWRVLLYTPAKTPHVSRAVNAQPHADVAIFCTKQSYSAKHICQWAGKHQAMWSKAQHWAKQQSPDGRTT